MTQDAYIYVYASMCISLGHTFDHSIYCICIAQLGTMVSVVFCNPPHPSNTRVFCSLLIGIHAPHLSGDVYDCPSYMHVKCYMLINAMAHP